MSAKIRRDDEVVVIAGKDKGRRGKVLQVRPDSRVLESGVNLIKKQTKPNQMLVKQGGIVEKEAPLHILTLLYSILKMIKQSVLVFVSMRMAPKYGCLNLLVGSRGISPCA